MECQLVNPLHGDPALLLQLPQSREMWLLDCGDLRTLELSTLQRVTTVFLSHGHIDHWIGLDQLVRAQLFAKIPLRILGPAGLVRMLTGRLQGYAWNLTADSLFEVQAWEWTGQAWEGTRFACCDAFRPSFLELKWPDLRGWSLQWVELEHGVPCLGYALRAPLQVRFRGECPIAPGPWVEQLKSAYRQGRPEQVILGQPAGALFEWLEPLPAKELGYITDTRLDAQTRERIVAAWGSLNTLVCESAFLSEQAQLAQEKLHATTEEAALLAGELNCQRLFLMHLSRRSQGLAEPYLEQAQKVFPATLASQHFSL